MLHPGRRLVAATFLIVLAAACAKKETVAPLPAAPPAQSSQQYTKQILEWQKERAERLRSEDGWLTLAGLYWLEAGANRVGSSESAPIRLPAGKAPAEAGNLTLEGAAVRFESAPGAGFTSGGKPVTMLTLLPDAAKDGPTVVEKGPLSFYVIDRTGKLGVRVKDRESEARTTFKGLNYYPVDPRWRVDARFEPYNPPKQIPIVNVLGMVENMPSPGALVFDLDGRTYRLDPVLERGETDFFLMFADTTSGSETYGAGRYLYASPPDARGIVIVDFNKAYNPPCAFTRFATCPLPPRQNRLPIRVAAGEKKFEATGH